MKPMNFPLRKLERQAAAQKRTLTDAEKIAAREHKSKKDRTSKAKLFR